MNMRCDADKGDIPKHFVKGPTGIIHRSRCSRMLSMFLRGGYTICIYMLYVYIIYVIDIRGNRLTEGTSMY